MRLRVPDRSERDERGAIAILTALLAVLVLAMAAVGVDITTQVNQTQKLHDTIDAAAHAASYSLPIPPAGAPTAMQAALAFFDANNGPPSTPPVVPTVDFFCVVAPLWNGSTWVVDTTQIPSTCNPASAKVGAVYPSARCNSKICAIPCNPAAGDLCNTVRVTGQKPVPFSFAPVIGINQGNTGAVTSVACKGSCGTIPPNPMDVAVVADRTGSMSSNDINSMIAGIKGMFQKMTPSQQYVALGTIGWSSGTAPSNCKSLDYGSNPTGPSDTSGRWLPVPFSNDYLTLRTTTPNLSSPLVQAVNCLTNSSGTGTHLASPMKAAARYLLGPSSPYDPSNNISLLPARTGIVRKAIIFETDGAPNEKFTGGDPALNSSGGIGSTSTNTDKSCDNFRDVAENAKAAGILVVTVAYNVSSGKCSSMTNSVRLVDRLAAAATDQAPGVPSTVGTNDCGSVGGRNTENADGDYFFCAASGSDMASIFSTALGQLAKGIRMIQLP